MEQRNNEMQDGFYFEKTYGLVLNCNHSPCRDLFPLKPHARLNSDGKAYL